VSRQELGIFSLPPCPYQLWAHPVSYPTGTRGLFPWS